MNFSELEKPVFFCAVINKSGLQAGLNPNHHRFVDIPPGLLLTRQLNIEFA